MQRFIIIFICSAILIGCHPHLYHPSIEQGNIITAQMIKQLQIGMTQKQVEKIMGSSVLQNTFNDDLVSYVYSFKPGVNKEKVVKKQVILTFSKGRLAKIETNL